MTKLQKKKWIDPQNIKITDARLKVFIDGEIKDETAQQQDQALQAFIEQLWLEKKGLISATRVEKLEALKQMRIAQQTLESDEPDQQTPLRMLKKLGAKQYGASAHLAEENIKYRDGIRQENKDQLGAAGRGTRIRNIELRKQAIVKCYQKLKALNPRTKKTKSLYEEISKKYNVGWSTVKEYLLGV